MGHGGNAVCWKTLQFARVTGRSIKFSCRKADKQLVTAESSHLQPKPWVARVHIIIHINRVLSPLNLWQTSLTGAPFAELWHCCISGSPFFLGGCLNRMGADSTYIVYCAWTWTLTTVPHLYYLENITSSVFLYPSNGINQHSNACSHPITTQLDPFCCHNKTPEAGFFVKKRALSGSQYGSLQIQGQEVPSFSLW